MNQYINTNLPKTQRTPLVSNQINIPNASLPKNPDLDFLKTHGFVPHNPTPKPETEKHEKAVRTGYNDDGEDIWQIIEKPVIVPNEVSKRQLFHALLDEGLDLKEAVLIAIEQIEDEKEKEHAKIDYEFSNMIQRDYPLLEILLEKLNKTNEWLDNLFIKASLY